jgi:hypothetical protein
MTPVEELPKPNIPRQAFGGSGHASPSGFPFFSSSTSGSARGTPTPAGINHGVYDHASDAFNYPHSQSAHLRHSAQSSTTGYTTGSGGPGTGTNSPATAVGQSNITPKATPLLGNSPPNGNGNGGMGELTAAYGSEGLPWGRMGHSSSTPMAGH